MTEGRLARENTEHADPVALVYESGDASESSACTDLLAAGDSALAVSLRDRPDDWLAARADAGLSPRFVATYPHPDCVRVVSDPGDLPTLALAVDDALASPSASETPAVCVDALSPLLAYAGPVRTGRFLAVLAARTRAAGGTLHCHGDADAVTALPAASLLFDGVVPGDSPQY